MAATGIVDCGSVQYGRLSKSVAGSANVTLTQTEYENGVLELTGALTGNIQVILPLIDGRTWVVYNNTSGAFTLTVIGATGTGVAVAQGKTAIVRSDGVNIVSSLTDMAAIGALSRIADDTIADGVDYGVGTGTGTKIGTAVSQKLGFWNATPIVQPAHADQATVTGPVAFNNTNGEIAGLTISAAYSQAEIQALQTACEELADDCRALRDVVAAQNVLLLALRTALVNAGIIKGAA